MRVHFIGIGGTGMGAVAGLLAQAGHEVRGSDNALYPPMSEQLAALGVPVATPYAAANLDWAPDVVVVGNAHSRDHIEVAAARDKGLSLTSFPAILGDHFLRDRHSIVVTGTHGKTTTTSIIAHVLLEAGRDPSLFVGGVPMGFGQGLRLGAGPDFVVEGDEYDTAYFDKESKFLHYHPRSAVLTSVELDHVDIFSGLEAVEAAFRKFVALLPSDGLLVVCADDERALAAAAAAPCRVERYGVAAEGSEAAGPPPAAAGVHWWATEIEIRKSGRAAFDVYRGNERVDRFESLLVGRHNVANCLAAIAVCVDRGVPIATVRRGIATFAGVRRRQELRGVAAGVTVLDDYAHHPTAVRETLRALRTRFANRRLIAVYEPRSATSRRNTFQADFAAAFSLADEVVIGAMFDPSRIPASERFDPSQLAADLRQAGTKASYIPEVADIASLLSTSTGPGDVIVLLSSGSFGGLHDRILDSIGDAIRPARRGHMASIRALLARCGLGAERAVDDDASHFFALSNERGTVGCVALEVLGEDAILRALAVDSDFRGAGYGWMLADTCVAHARHRGARRIYLLTASASDFFATKLGFRVVDRSTASADVAASQTFRASAGTDVVAMRLDI